MDEKFLFSAMKATGIKVVTFDENTPAPPKQEQPGFWTVAIYLQDREYGGPEEGGWWYDSGRRLDSLAETGLTPAVCEVVPSLFRNEDDAYGFAGHVNAILDATVNKQRRSDTGSVLSEGRFAAEVHEGWPPKYYPGQRPYYE
jgi:hypothetical protein